MPVIVSIAMLAIFITFGVLYHLNIWESKTHGNNTNKYKISWLDVLSVWMFSVIHYWASIINYVAPLAWNETHTTERIIYTLVHRSLSAVLVT